MAVNKIDERDAHCAQQRQNERCASFLCHLLLGLFVHDCSVYKKGGFREER